MVKKYKFYESMIKLLITSMFISYAVNLFGIQLQMSELVIYLLLAFVLIDSLLGKLSIKIDIDMFFVILSLLAVFTIATIFSDNKIVSLKGELKWIIGISLSIILPSIVEKSDLDIKILLKHILKIGTLVSFLKIIQIIITRKVDLAGIEVFGFGANQWGQIAAILLCINTVYIHTEINKKKYITYFLLNEIILILTMSMTNWIVGNAMVLLIYFKLNKKNRVKNLIIATVLFIVVAIIFKNIISIFFNDRIIQIIDAFQDPLKYKTMEIRYSIWNTAIELGINNKFGVGLYNLQFYLPVNHAHNIFLEILGSTGVLGLTLFVIYMIMILIKCYRISRVNDANYYYKIGMLYAIVSYIISNNFSDSFGARTHLFFWIITGLIFSLKGSNKSHEN